MTNLERLTIKSILTWCKGEGIKVTSRPHHLHPRAYILARPASACLWVVTPPMDAEYQVQNLNRKLSAHIDGAMTVHLFDGSLRAGQWCSVAYVCMGGRQEHVAIPAVTALQPEEG